MSENEENDEKALNDVFREVRARQDKEKPSEDAVEVEKAIKMKQEEIDGALNDVGPDAKIFEIPAGVLPESTEPPKVRNVPDMGTGREDLPPVDPWSRNVPELGKVSVTPAEWETFYRNFLLGSRQKLLTRIEVLPGEWFECVVQMLTPGEKELLALVVSRILKTHPVLTEGSADQTRDLVRADSWLKLEVLTRFVKITGSPDWSPIVLDLKEDMLPEEYPDIEVLARASRTRFNNNQIFPLLIRSLHLAATKFTIMEDALANRDFTNPADAD